MKTTNTDTVQTAAPSNNPIGKRVKSKDGDPRFSAGVALRWGLLPGRIMVKWAHGEAWADVWDLDIIGT